MPGLRHFIGLAFILGWQDVKDTYRRSSLGPLWITIGLGVQIATIGAVFGLIFGSDLNEYLPFLGVSLVLWNYIVATVNDSTSAYLQSQQVMKQIEIPSYLPIARIVSKNLAIFAHNFSLIVLVLVIFQKFPGPALFALVPGLVVLITTVYAASTLSGIVSARYRDFSPIVMSVLTISFYLTPIIWMPSSLPERFREPVLAFNPFFHLMELVRAPLLGAVPPVASWLVGISLAVSLFAVAWLISRRYAWKIVYWL